MLIPGHKIKVEVFCESQYSVLQENVNLFLADLDHNVIDIKFSNSSGEHNESGFTDYCAMIIYTQVKD
ncbi:sporulation protein Cse60 [Candidatus Izimaplasma bacterium ZiA1]|uniref:sporulation protein Cse60 n=1 Tax=Candidatus Izimoplasma sp. ZiA1 TaxID=2024899 RepID=UPI00143C08FD